MLDESKLSFDSCPHLPSVSPRKNRKSIPFNEYLWKLACNKESHNYLLLRVYVKLLYLFFERNCAKILICVASKEAVISFYSVFEISYSLNLRRTARVQGFAKFMIWRGITTEETEGSEWWIESCDLTTSWSLRSRNEEIRRREQWKVVLPSCLNVESCLGIWHQKSNKNHLRNFTGLQYLQAEVCN